MSANEQVRITFLRVALTEHAESIGSGRFRFRGEVGTRRFGEIEGQIASVDVRDGTTQLDLEAFDWTCLVTVAGLSSLTVGFRGEDCQQSRTTLGSTRHRFSQVLNLPGGGRLLVVAQGEYQDVHENFTVVYRVEPIVGGRTGIHRPDTVFATRAHEGSVTYTTVAGNVQIARFEICPMLPVPPADTLPPRPRFPRGARPGRARGAVGTISASDPLNKIANPSLIPILTQRTASAGNTARIACTYYRPDSLNFTDNDRRLEWTAEPADRVRFLRNDRWGLSVKVYGIGDARSADTEVTLTVKFRGAEFAKYRAIVGHLKTILCRFNIFMGPAGPAGDLNRSRPRATPEAIADMMAVANMYLRQMGIRLALDSDATLNTTNPDGGAAITVTASATTGIYTVDVPDGHTRNAPFNSRWLSANYRENVLNFCYIKSSALADAGGFAFCWPAHPARPASARAGGRWDSHDNGTPSTSWKQPSGVKPDRDAEQVTMKVIAGANFVTGAAFANLYGMVVIDTTDPATAAGRVSKGGTIAHEVGHLLCLGHRVESATIAGGDYDDEINYPPRQNKMYYMSSDLAKDFDIIQTKVARGSPLCR